ncbi:hypothetical protein [Chloroflexus sp.]|uniref:hypothetical protein n=1 Tax=Chloroflexus sp. TaxID=1904827 RepID=UPI002ACD4E81|nr:hypothetical protein [Chloroflexus sp.]
MRRRTQHAFLALGLILALTVALWPRPTYAACDLNIGCYVDEGIVTFLRFLAQLGWFFNGNLLLVSRWIEEQRNWLVNDVMAAVFDGLLKGASVAWAQAVVIAVIVFVIGFSLRAIAELNWVDLKRGIRNGVFALIVFTYGAQLMAASENGRVILSQAAAEMAKDSLTTAGAAQMLTGGTSRPGDLMPPTATIYPDEKCGGAVPPRTTPGIMINDIAANYLFATAEDIHCTSESGASENAPALPRVFWEGGEYPTASMGASNGSVQFVGFYSRNPGNAADEEDRRRIVGLAMDGAVRQLFGLFLVIAAVLEQVIQLLFALGLVSLWFALSIGLVFALFVPTEGMLSSIIRTGIELLKQSVLTTIGVTLVGFVISTTAGSSGVNAGLVAFIGLLALVVLVMLLVNTGRVIFSTVSDLSSTTLGAAPAAVLGAVGGMGLAAGMALRGHTAAQEAAAGARDRAEADARASGASDKEIRQAGNRAARAAYSSALNASAVRTFNDVGRAVTDAAGFIDDPLRQSIRWQDRAEAERRQKEIIAAMELRDEAISSSPTSSPANAPVALAFGAAGSQNSSAAQRLRGLAPASPDNPYVSETTPLNTVSAQSSQATGDSAADLAAAERQADAEVEVVGKALQRAQAERALVQQQLATAQGRAAVQQSSVLNEREIRRLSQQAEGVSAEVARLRQQLDEAERLQRQVRGDADTRREQETAQRAWGTVQATEGQRDPVSGSTPQLVIRSSIGLAQQQLTREQQQLDRRPADDPSVAEDRAWLQRQEAVVNSLRRWNEALARPNASPADRVAGEVAVHQIREEAEREQQAAKLAGNKQRERIAGGIASLARSMLPPTGAPVGAPVAAAPSARNGAQAPAGGATKGATSVSVAPVIGPSSSGSLAVPPAASEPAAAATSGPGSQVAPGMTSTVAHSSSAAQRLRQPAGVQAPTGAAVGTPAAPAPASTSTPAAVANGVQAPAGAVIEAPAVAVPASSLAVAGNGVQVPTGAVVEGLPASIPTAVGNGAQAPVGAAVGVPAAPTPASALAAAPVVAGNGVQVPAGAAVGVPAFPAPASAPASTPAAAGNGAQAPTGAAVGITHAGNGSDAHLGQGGNVSPTASVASSGPASAPAPALRNPALSAGAKAPAGEAAPSTGEATTSRRLRVGGVTRGARR